MERAQRTKRLWGTILVTFVIVIGLLALLIALYFPSQEMARSFCNIAAERYGIRCQLQKVSLRFGLRFIEAIRLVGLTIFDPGTEEILLQSKEIRVIPRLSLGGQEGWIGVQGIEVEEPVLHLRRTKRGRWNLQEMLAASDADQAAFPLPNQITIRQGTIRMDETAFSGIELFAEAAPDGKVQVKGQKGSFKAILEMDSRRWPLIEGSVLLSDRGWRVRGSGKVQPSGRDGYRYRLLLQEGEVHLPDLQLHVTAGEIDGGLSLRGEGWLLQGEASLQGRVQSPWLREEDPITIEAAWTGRGGGDLQVTRLQVQSPSLGVLKLTGALKAWGQEGIQFRSEELHLQPALRHAILSRFPAGIQLEQISQPKLNGTLTGFHGPLDLQVLVDQLKIGVGGHSLFLQGVGGVFRGEGARWEGTGQARTISTTLADLQNVEMELSGREGMLQIRRFGLQLLAHPPIRLSGEGSVRWKGGTATLEVRGDMKRSTSSTNGHLNLLVALKRSPQGEWDSQGRLSADASALLELVRRYRETPFGADRGRLTADWEGVIAGAGTGDVSGQLHLEDVDLGFSPSGDPSSPFVTGVKGTVPFRLHGGRWVIPRTTVESRAGLFLSLQGSWDQHGGLQIDFDLPRTPVANLATSLQALLSSEVQGTGAVEVRGSWTGKGLRGEILLDQVHLKAGGLFLSEVNGKIPLGPMIHSLSPLQVHWPALTPEVHRRAQQEMASQSPQPQTLTMKALGYQRLALHDMMLSLIPGDWRIAIDSLAFQVYGGRGWGRGELDLANGAVRLALLFDDVSLRELLDQFPPIRGYLSGRVDGLTEFSIPFTDPTKAKGRGRWWVVKSPREERIISQEMIERLGGPPARFFQILTGRNRAYDAGVLTAVLEEAYLVFPELEISHRTLGMKDLEIRVVPPFNRIALDHLVGAILEAMERMGGPALP